MACTSGTRFKSLSGLAFVTPWTDKQIDAIKIEILSVFIAASFFWSLFIGFCVGFRMLSKSRPDEIEIHGWILLKQILADFLPGLQFFVICLL
jgi:hypothetical protein